MLLITHSKDELPKAGRPGPPGGPWGPALSLPLINFSCSLPLPSHQRSSQGLCVIQWAVSEMARCRRAGWVEDTLLHLSHSPTFCLFLKSSARILACNSFTILFLDFPPPCGSIKVHSLFVRSVPCSCFHRFSFPIFHPLYSYKIQSIYSASCQNIVFFLPHFRIFHLIFSSLGFWAFPISHTHRLKTLGTWTEVCVVSFLLFRLLGWNRITHLNMPYSFKYSEHKCQQNKDATINV